MRTWKYSVGQPVWIRCGSEMTNDPPLIVQHRCRNGLYLVGPKGSRSHQWRHAAQWQMQTRGFADPPLVFLPGDFVEFNRRKSSRWEEVV